MSAFTKMMGWDQIKEDASMMKGQGDQLMSLGRGMYNRGSGFLSGKGDWYDNAMSTFMRNQRDTQGQAGRNITRGFASKGASGGFADLINANMSSAQRLGEGSSGFFSQLYRQGADIGTRLQIGAQGYTGQANQAYSKGADLSKARSDISTGLLNSAIGLGGGLLAQGMASKGSERIANIMMGNDPAKSSGATKGAGWGKRLGWMMGINEPTGPGALPPIPKLEQITGGSSFPSSPMKRFALPNLSGPRSNLPGQWQRRIEDWQAANPPEQLPPEPGAGWYGVGGNSNTYSPSPRIGLGQNISNWARGLGWDSNFLPPWGERSDR